MVFFATITRVGSKPRISIFLWTLLIIVLLAIDASARLDSLNLNAIDVTNRVSTIPFNTRATRTKRSTDDTSSSAIQPEQTVQTQTESEPSTTRVPDSTVTSLLSTSGAHFDARDVTYFLESHPAHSIQDPRTYFTDERSPRSLAILLNELKKIPSRLRFAFMTRVFNELGRKIGSKLNYYSTEVAAILRKTPDDLGNKPEVSMLVDAVRNAFESKDDTDPKKEDDEQLVLEDSISRLINSDREKLAVFNSSLTETGTYFAHIISYFAVTATNNLIKIPDSERESMATVLGEALQMGCKTFITEVSSNDKFRIPDEIIHYTERVLTITVSIFRRHLRDNDDTAEESIKKSFTAKDVESFEDLNPMSDKTGLVGPWNNYIFANLGTSERVVKLFAGLLARVPAEVKSRWINMYIDQVYNELERTLSGFVVMQGMPYNNNASEIFLLDPTRSVNIMPVKLPRPRTNYSADKNRIPARCYLAGRRWRLVLTRALKGYQFKDDVIKSFADKLSEFKVKLVKKSGNDIYRLCMPRLEVGIRGWGINGDPQNSAKSNNFPLRNPLEHLDDMDNPFVSGVKLGYKFGVKIGYNEERNATLEIESTGGKKSDFKDKIESETKYLALASYRRASTVGAKESFKIAVREGYLTTLRVSVRSGIRIPSEAGSRMSSLKCVSLAGQAGMEAGRTVVENYLIDRKMLDKTREALVKVGEAHGLLAGEVMGKTVGAIVGKEAAEEAYRGGIVRGGKVSRAKFRLEEYEAGSKLGLEYGLKEGKRIASSSELDPSAPKLFKFIMPVFSEKDKVELDVDHWEKDLIPPLTSQTIFNLQMTRNHTTVTGSLRGFYKTAKEVKKGFKRVSYTNLTYNLEVFADGFIMDGIAYLRLNGTVNNLGNLHGSLMARDIFNIDDL